MKKMIQSLLCAFSLISLVQENVQAMPRKKTNKITQETASPIDQEQTKEAESVTNYTPRAAGGPGEISIYETSLNNAFSPFEDDTKTPTEENFITRPRTKSHLLGIIHQAQITKKEERTQISAEDLELLAKTKQLKLAAQKQHIQTVQEQKNQQAARQRKKANQKERLQEQLKAKKLELEREENRKISAQYSQKQRAANLKRINAELAELEDLQAQEQALEAAAKEVQAAKEEADRTLLDRPFAANKAITPRDRKQALEDFLELCFENQDTADKNIAIVHTLERIGSVNPRITIDGNPTTLIYALVMRTPNEFFNEELFTYMVKNLTTEEVKKLKYFSTSLTSIQSTILKFGGDSSLFDIICAYKNKQALTILLQHHPDLYTHLQNLENPRWIKFLLAPNGVFAAGVYTKESTIAMLDCLKESITAEDMQRREKNIPGRLVTINALLPRGAYNPLFLHLAIEYDAEETVVDHLLSQREHSLTLLLPVRSINSDSNLLTAPYIAIKNKNLLLLNTLYRYEADFTTCTINGKSLLVYAVEQNSSEIVTYLSQKDEFATEDMKLKHKNLLINAIIKADYNNDIITTLLDAKDALGIDVNHIDPSDGTTALYKAARNNNLALVKTLIEKGANPNLHGPGADHILHSINCYFAQDAWDRSEIYTFLTGHGAKESAADLARFRPLTEDDFKTNN